MYTDDSEFIHFKLLKYCHFKINKKRKKTNHYYYLFCKSYSYLTYYIPTYTWTWVIFFTKISNVKLK